MVFLQCLHLISENLIKLLPTWRPQLHFLAPFLLLLFFFSGVITVLRFPPPLTSAFVFLGLFLINNSHKETQILLQFAAAAGSQLLFCSFVVLNVIWLHIAAEEEEGGGGRCLVQPVKHCRSKTPGALGFFFFFFSVSLGCRLFVFASMFYSVCLRCGRRTLNYWERAERHGRNFGTIGFGSDRIEMFQGNWKEFVLQRKTCEQVFTFQKAKTSERKWSYSSKTKSLKLQQTWQRVELISSKWMKEFKLFQIFPSKNDHHFIVIIFHKQKNHIKNRYKEKKQQTGECISIESSVEGQII